MQDKPSMVAIVIVRFYHRQFKNKKKIYRSVKNDKRRYK